MPPPRGWKTGAGAEGSVRLRREAREEQGAGYRLDDEAPRRSPAKLTKAELDFAELEKLIIAEMRQRDFYCDGDGISGAFLANETDRIAPLVAEHVAMPPRGGFFDPLDYLIDTMVRDWTLTFCWSEVMHRVNLLLRLFRAVQA